jgi:AcrR family transcriptional regulator
MISVGLGHSRLLVFFTLTGIQPILPFHLLDITAIGCVPLQQKNVVVLFVLSFVRLYVYLFKRFDCLSPREIVTMNNPRKIMKIPDVPPPPPDYDEEAEELLMEKRRKFFVAAEPMFVRYGFKKTTVEEICAEAGASKRTFYELFSDKTDCFLQLIIYISHEMIGKYKSMIKPDMPAPERLEIYLDVYLEAVFSRPVFRLVVDDPNLLRELTMNTANSVQFFNAVTAFTELVEYGIERGEFRPMSSDAVTWIVHSLMDGLYLLGMEMHPTPDHVDSPEFEKEVIAFIRHGLGVHDE